MEDIASKRRDNVALFKKIFLFVKLGVMFVLSIVGSAYFVWGQFYAQLNHNRNPNPTIEQCLQWCGENKISVASSVICCFVACCFLAFLALHGVQTLVVKFMMRKANTGG